MHCSFVSDVTTRDFDFTMEFLKSYSDKTKKLVAQWEVYIKSKKWKVQEHSYWNSYDPLWKLPNDLKAQFSASSLVIFQGLPFVVVSVLFVIFLPYPSHSHRRSFSFSSSFSLFIDRGCAFSASPR